MKTQTKKISKRIFRIIGAALLVLAVAAITAVLVFFLTLPCAAEQARQRQGR